METLPERARHDEVERDRNDVKLVVSTYDRVSSLLIGLLILLGAGVLGLVIVVYSMRVFDSKQRDPIVVGRGTGIDQYMEAKYGLDSEAIVEDFSEEDNESRRHEWSPSELERFVAQAEAAAPKGNPDLTGKKVGPDGPGGPPIDERVPRAERWEIRFQGVGLEEYARQLDFFKIELAVLDTQANLIRYTSQVSDDRPETRNGPSKDEQRLHMIWQGGPLAKADRKLLDKAGIETSGKISLQFYPAETEGRLAEIEKQAAGDRSVNDIRKTIFGIEKEGDGYAFFVIRQRFFTGQ